MVISNSSYISKIAFSFWMIYVLKVAIVAWIFSSSPAFGTLFNFGTSCFFFFLLALVSRGKLRSSSFAPAVFWLKVYIVWTGLSLFWTQADSIMVAGFYWSGIVVDMFVVWFLIGLDKNANVLKASLMGIIIGGLVLVFLIIFVFHVGSSGRIENAILHTNSLGNLLGLSVICMLYFFPDKKSIFRYKGWWYAICCLLLIGLLMTLSKTSIMAFLIAFVSFFYFSHLARGRIVVLLLFVLLITSFFWSEIETYLNTYLFEEIGNNMTKFDTLSGRTLLWDEVWYMIKEALFVGYGFMSFRDVGPNIFSVGQVQAHNELLHQWFTLGLCGVFLTIMVYSSSIRYWWKCRAENSHTSIQAVLALTMVIYYLARGLTEAYPIGLVFPSHLILLLLSVATEKGRVRQVYKTPLVLLNNKKVNV
jgi:exopolysaccharide production protein ExoQ